MRRLLASGMQTPDAESFLMMLESRRTPDTPRSSTKLVANEAREFARNVLQPLLRDFRHENKPVEIHGPVVYAEIALNLALFAEDLLSGGFLWRVIEEYNDRHFGTPLPLVFKPGESPLPVFDVLDERRFRFFLYTVWQYEFPDVYLPPGNALFRAIAAAAVIRFEKIRPEAFSAEAWFTAPETPEEAVEGVAIKRKLIWLGRASFLLTPAFYSCISANLDKNESPGKAFCDINKTDDFLCQECTIWSGLGAIDILADVLGLTGSDRDDLLSWSQRHRAFFRIESLPATPTADGSIRINLTARNLINDKNYAVPMFVKKESDCPFSPGMIVVGSLARWRGAWRWAGGQHTAGRGKPGYENTAEFREIKNRFLAGNSGIVYRYRPDLLANARETEAVIHAHFTEFYGKDFCVFPDGLSFAAAEQKRMKSYAEARAKETGTAAGEFYNARGIAPDNFPLNLPDRLLKSTNGVALFYRAGEGTEIFHAYDDLCAALRTGKPEKMSRKKQNMLNEFLRNPDISPEFVRRVTGEIGSDGIIAFYCGIDAAGVDDDFKKTALEYLLRSFKGSRLRENFPAITVTA